MTMTQLIKEMVSIIDLSEKMAKEGTMVGEALLLHDLAIDIIQMASFAEQRSRK